MGWKEKPAGKFYIKINELSKQEILEALKTKSTWSKVGRKPAGLLVREKLPIPTKILEELFDLKKADINFVQCRVGMHDWTPESSDGRKFCRRCFDWRRKESAD